jgi:hypothetical protein
VKRRGQNRPPRPASVWVTRERADSSSPVLPAMVSAGLASAEARRGGERVGTGDLVSELGLDEISLLLSFESRLASIIKIHESE